MEAALSRITSGPVGAGADLATFAADLLLPLRERPGGAVGVPMSFAIAEAPTCINTARTFPRPSSWRLSRFTSISSASITESPCQRRAPPAQHDLPVAYLS